MLAISGVTPTASGRPSRRLRVMFCTDSMEIGGTELNAVRTAERLDRSRFELGVVCMRHEGPLAARYAAADVPLYPFPISSLYGASTVGQGARLAKFLRDQRVDVFHAHDRYSNIFGVPWARLAGIPGVIASRRWWQAQTRMGHRVANRFAYRFAHSVLANSPRVAELLEHTEGVPAHRVAVVPNFLDESAFIAPDPETQRTLLAELGVPPGVPTIGIVANLRPVKDQATLLRALALLHREGRAAHLVLVGEGDTRGDLEALAAELNIRDHVHFAGRRPSHPNLHHLFDVSVLCSVSEGLSNSLLEAMAAGNPIVATDVGGTRDAVVDGETGILVPPADPPRLSDALGRLLSEPPVAKRMGAAGLARARNLFSPEAALGSLEALYQRVAGKRAFPAGTLVYTSTAP